MKRGPLLNLLQEALTLVAHENPEDCPSYHQLLGEEAHSRLADEVSAAILRSALLQHYSS
jgi:hypothetical protein